MKYLKTLGLAMIAAAAMTAFAGAGTASAATELFSGNSTLSEGQAITSSLAAGNSAILANTSESIVNTCTTSSVNGKTTNTTGATVNGNIESLTFTNCTNVVHTKSNGSLSIENIGGGNGTVRSSGSLVGITVFGVECLYGTGLGTHLGTMNGTTDITKHASLTINAVINEQEPKKLSCPDTTKWTASYVATSPTGLNVGE